MKNSEKADLVRKACVKAYNMDLDEFATMYGEQEANEYIRTKWQKMQRNFSRWFCQLDSKMAKKFVEDL